MTVYIPIIGILWLLLAYVIVGVLAFVPLAIWSNRFVYGQDSWHKGLKIWNGIGISAVAWLYILITLAAMEIDYRRRGIL